MASVLHISIHNAHGLLQRTEVNEQVIESLAPRVKVFSESLCEPIRPGDVNEKDRGDKLER